MSDEIARMLGAAVLIGGVVAAGVKLYGTALRDQWLLDLRRHERDCTIQDTLMDLMGGLKDDIKVLQADMKEHNRLHLNQAELHQRR